MRLLHRAPCRAAALALLGLTTSARAADTPWLARLGVASPPQVRNTVAVDAAGNAIVGLSPLNASFLSTDALVVKYGADGHAVWQRSLDYAGEYDTVIGVATDAQGNVFALVNSVLSRGSGAVGMLLKYDPDGTELWRRTLTGTAPSGAGGAALKLDGLGEPLVARCGWNGTNFDILVATVDANGGALWERQYNGIVNLDDYANALALDGAGNVIVAAVSTGRLGRDPQTGTYAEDFLTLKYSPAGALLWERREEGYPTVSSDVPRSVAVDAAGGIVVSGDSNNLGSGGSTLSDIFTVKYDAAGNRLWRSLIDGPGHSYDYGAAVSSDGAGNSYVTGQWINASFRAEIVTTKYGPAGAIVWQRNYLTPQDVQTLAATNALDAQGRLFVGGSSQYVADNNGTRALTLAYDGDGNLQWTQRYGYVATAGTPSGDRLDAMAPDGRGNVVIVAHSGPTGTATLRYTGATPFMPPTDNPAPAPLNAVVRSGAVSQGVVVSGSPSLLASSDDQSWVLAPVRAGGSVEVVLEAGATPPTALSLLLETGTTHPSLRRTLSLFNFQTGGYETIQTATTTPADSRATLTFSGDLSRFVDPAAHVLRARLRFDPLQRVNSWNVRLDQFLWTYTPAP